MEEVLVYGSMRSVVSPPGPHPELLTSTHTVLLGSCEMTDSHHREPHC
jgi:hypothetical protein